MVSTFCSTLGLASKAFKFNKFEFVKNISRWVVAMELSHNYGKNDDHLPIKKNTWYWKIIKNPKFKDIPKVLEFRNTNISKVKSVYKSVIG